MNQTIVIGGTFTAEAKTAQSSITEIFGKVNAKRLRVAAANVRKARAKGVKIPYPFRLLADAMEEGYPQLTTKQIKLPEATVKDFEEMAEFYYQQAFPPKMSAGLDRLLARYRSLEETAKEWKEVKKLMAKALDVPVSDITLDTDTYFGARCDIGETTFWVYIGDEKSWMSAWYNTDGHGNSYAGKSHKDQALYKFLLSNK